MTLPTADHHHREFAIQDIVCAKSRACDGPEKAATVLYTMYTMTHKAWLEFFLGGLEFGPGQGTTVQH